MSLDKYSSIINIPYVKSNKKHMTLEERAAQFQPFSALTGYEDSLDETNRITENKKLVTQDIKKIINEKINILLNHKDEIIKICYFSKDQKKQGGQYKIIEGKLKKINGLEHTIILQDNTEIIMNNIYTINSPLLDSIFNDFN